MSKQVFEIDGSITSTLQEFANDFTQKLNLDIDWQGNLDAFNDILYGGFGTPKEGETVKFFRTQSSLCSSCF